VAVGAHLVQGTLQCKGSNGELVSGVIDLLLIPSKLQQPFQAPQLLPNLRRQTAFAKPTMSKLVTEHG